MDYCSSQTMVDTQDEQRFLPCPAQSTINAPSIVPVSLPESLAYLETLMITLGTQVENDSPAEFKPSSHNRGAAREFADVFDLE
jgi:hypothetical protein